MAADTPVAVAAVAAANVDAAASVAASIAAVAPVAVFAVEAAAVASVAVASFAAVTAFVAVAASFAVAFSPLVKDILLGIRRRRHRLCPLLHYLLRTIEITEGIISLLGLHSFLRCCQFGLWHRIPSRKRIGKCSMVPQVQQLGLLPLTI